MSSVALFINRGSACRDAIARAWHCQNGRQPRINDDEPHRIVAAAPLFFLSLTWQHTFRFSLSLSLLQQFTSRTAFPRCARHLCVPVREFLESVWGQQMRGNWGRR